MPFEASVYIPGEGIGSDKPRETLDFGELLESDAKRHV